MARKKKGRLSEKARKAEARRKAELLARLRKIAGGISKRSAAARKGWLTRRATEAAKSRKARAPLFEEPFFEEDFEQLEQIREEADYVDVIGIDSLYMEEM
jgi:hypothetical protein